MRDEADRLENSNKTLQERFLAAQSDASRLMREKSALANEVADLRRRLEAAERANETRFTGHKSDEDSRSRILQLQVTPVIRSNAMCLDITSPYFRLGATGGGPRRVQQEGSGIYTI